MDKFELVPDQTGYGFTDPQEVAYVNLEGGHPRYRKDMLDSTQLIDVQWTCDQEEFDYLQEYFRDFVAENAPEFEIDLMIDNQLVTRMARFMPGTIKVTNSALTYVVSAQLDVVDTPHSDAEAWPLPPYGTTRFASVNVTLGALTVSAAAKAGNHVNVTLGALTVTATAQVKVKGNAVIQLGALVAQGTATLGGTVQVNATLGALTVAATATVSTHAVVDRSLDPLIVTATAVVV